MSLGKRRAQVEVRACGVDHLVGGGGGGVRVSGFGLFWVQGSGFRVQGFGFRV